jgi:hypothetical protein
MLRFSAPIVALATLAILLAGCGQAAVRGRDHARRTPPRRRRPPPHGRRSSSRSRDGTAEGSYASDSKASLATCSLSSTGVRSLLYAGGESVVSI